MSSAALRDKLEALLGSTVAELARVSGGDINETFGAALRDGRRVFVKTHASPPPAMYACEAEGLRCLGEARALRVPHVLAHAEADARGPAVLVLERIDASRRARDFDEALGRGLAALHRSGLPELGWSRDNYIAVLAQKNAPRASWAAFYGEQRLLAQVELAVARGRASRALAARVEGLCARLPALVGPEEPPARLHGDLWSGNVISDERGAPCLIDPAVYGGAREIDLAMMRLFGGFSERVFAAYDEAYALPEGHEERVALYQLYPLLVHVNLFGGSYVAAVERALSQLL